MEKQTNRVHWNLLTLLAYKFASTAGSNALRRKVDEIETEKERRKTEKKKKKNDYD